MPSQYLVYGDCEIVNGCRTLQYMQNSTFPLSKKCGVHARDISCSCCTTSYDEDGFDCMLPESGEYVDPVADPAPWYSTVDPRSQFFLGAMIADWNESDPYVRDSIDNSRVGKATAARKARKEIVIKFFLAVTDCCAIDYAKAWFFNQLDCAASSYSNGNSCSSPQLSWHECCQTAWEGTEIDGYRMLPSASIINIEWAKEPTMYGNCCIGIECDVTFASDQSDIYDTCYNVVYEGPIYCDGEPQAPFVECSGLQCRIGECCDHIVASCDYPCDVVAPVAALSTLTTCYCEPIETRRVCLQIEPNDRLGFHALDFVIKAGATEVKNVRIRGWEHNGLNQVNSDMFKCIPACFDYGISRLAPYSKLDISSTYNTRTYRCNNMAISGNLFAEQIGGGPLRYAQYGCQWLYLCFDLPEYFPDDVTICIYRRHGETR